MMHHLSPSISTLLQPSYHTSSSSSSLPLSSSTYSLVHNKQHVPGAMEHHHHGTIAASSPRSSFIATRSSLHRTEEASLSSFAEHDCALLQDDDSSSLSQSSLSSSSRPSSTVVSHNRTSISSRFDTSSWLSSDGDDDDGSRMYGHRISSSIDSQDGRGDLWDSDGHVVGIVDGNMIQGNGMLQCAPSSAAHPISINVCPFFMDNSGNNKHCHGNATTETITPLSNKDMQDVLPISPQPLIIGDQSPCLLRIMGDNQMITSCRSSIENDVVVHTAKSHNLHGSLQQDHDPSTRSSLSSISSFSSLFYDEEDDDHPTIMDQYRPIHPDNLFSIIAIRPSFGTLSSNASSSFSDNASLHHPETLPRQEAHHHSSHPTSSRQDYHHPHLAVPITTTTVFPSFTTKSSLSTNPPTSQSSAPSIIISPSADDAHPTITNTTVETATTATHHENKTCVECGPIQAFVGNKYEQDLTEYTTINTVRVPDHPTRAYRMEDYGMTYQFTDSIVAAVVSDGHGSMMLAPGRYVGGYESARYVTQYLIARLIREYEEHGFNTDICAMIQDAFRDTQQSLCKHMIEYTHESKVDGFHFRQMPLESDVHDKHIYCYHHHRSTTTEDKSATHGRQRRRHRHSHHQHVDHYRYQHCPSSSIVPIRSHCCNVQERDTKNDHTTIHADRLSLASLSSSSLDRSSLCSSQSSLDDVSSDGGRDNSSTRHNRLLSTTIYPCYLKKHANDPHNRTAIIDYGTTTSLVLIIGRALYVAHVGDSDVYLYEPLVKHNNNTSTATASTTTATPSSAPMMPSASLPPSHHSSRDEAMTCIDDTSRGDPADFQSMDVAPQHVPSSAPSHDSSVVVHRDNDGITTMSMTNDDKKNKILQDGSTAVASLNKDVDNGANIIDSMNVTANTDRSIISVVNNDHHSTAASTTAHPVLLFHHSPPPMINHTTTDRDMSIKSSCPQEGGWFSTLRFGFTWPLLWNRARVQKNRCNGGTTAVHHPTHNTAVNPSWQKLDMIACHHDVAANRAMHNDTNVNTATVPSATSPTQHFRIWKMTCDHSIHSSKERTRVKRACMQRHHYPRAQLRFGQSHFEFDVPQSPPMTMQPSRRSSLSSWLGRDGTNDNGSDDKHHRHHRHRSLHGNMNKSHRHSRSNVPMITRKLMPSRSMGHPFLSQYGITHAPTITSTTLQAGDWIILGTDGFWNRPGIHYKVLHQLHRYNAAAHQDNTSTPPLQQQQQQQHLRIHGITADNTPLSSSSPGMITTIHAATVYPTISSDTRHSPPQTVDTLPTMSSNPLLDACCQMLLHRAEADDLLPEEVDGVSDPLIIQHVDCATTGQTETYHLSTEMRRAERGGRKDNTLFIVLHIKS